MKVSTHRPGLENYKGRVYSIITLKPDKSIRKSDFSEVMGNLMAK